jgi:hypothetical protein
MFKYIVYYFDLKLPEEAEALVKVCFNLGFNSLIILTCFINVFGSLISIYLIKHYDIESKYPKFR